MSRKSIGILIILIGLIGFLGLIYFMFFYKPVKVENTIEPEIKEVPEVQKEVLTPSPTIEKPKQEVVKTEQKRQITPKEVNQTELKRLASSFAERYGSFSNQSNFQNLKDLKVFMSSAMQVRINSYIEQSLAKRGDSSVYYGMSTKAIAASVQLLDNDSGKALILVQTLRQEAKETINNVSQKNQNIEISFIKEDNAWKVDEASWK